MVKEKYMRFEVVIEPKFIPEEGRTIEKFVECTLMVHARDINEAISTAKGLMNINPEDVDVTSVRTMHRVFSRGY